MTCALILSGNLLTDERRKDMTKIKVVMKQNYNDIVFYFNSCSEAWKFMETAISAGENLSFKVELEKEEDTVQGKEGEEDA